jgi:hypothetical protein
MVDDWLKREHLAQTERHIAQGERTIAAQRELVTALERAGKHARTACDLLRQFEVTQRLHIADRDRLRSELGDVRE